MKKNSLLIALVFLIISMAFPTQLMAAFAYSSWVDGFSPTRSGQGVSTSIQILGFFPSATKGAKLVFYDDGTVIPASSYSEQEDAYLIDWEGETRGSLISATFDLSSAPLGMYRVVVVDGLDDEISIDSPFSVEAGSEPRMWASITGQAAVRYSATTDVLVWYGNTGNSDELRSGILLVGIPVQLNCQLGFNPADYVLPADSGIVPSGAYPMEFTATYDGQEYRVLRLFLSQVPPLATTPLRLTVNWGTTAGSQRIKAWWAGSRPDNYSPQWPAN